MSRWVRWQIRKRAVIVKICWVAADSPCDCLLVVSPLLPCLRKHCARDVMIRQNFLDEVWLVFCGKSSKLNHDCRVSVRTIASAFSFGNSTCLPIHQVNRKIILSIFPSALFRSPHSPCFTSRLKRTIVLPSAMVSPVCMACARAYLDALAFMNLVIWRMIVWVKKLAISKSWSEKNQVGEGGRSLAGRLTYFRV